MKKKIVAIPVIFLSLLLIGSSLIYFGTRNDAVSVAKSIKSGVLTADEINVAFQNVGGKVIKKNVQESQWVKKGDVLYVLDDVDTQIAIDRTNAVISAQEAQIRQEESAIQIQAQEIDLTELTTWRKIEEVQANLESAKAARELAQIEYNRNVKLRESASISQSILDNVKNTLTQAKMAVVQSESQLSSLLVGATQEQLVKFNTTKNAQDMTLQSIVNLRQTLKNRQNQLAQLRAQLAQSKADLQQLEVNNHRLTLLAPEDGKVLQVLYEEGEMVPPGAPAVILETTRKYVDIYVNEKMVNNYLPETSVTGKVIALNKQIHGIVRFATVAPSFADLRTTRERGQADLTSYQVRIYVDDIPHLHTGMTIEVDDAKHR